MNRDQVPLATIAAQRTTHETTDMSFRDTWLLDGEVQRGSELAIAGGPDSDIWQGLWEGKKVTLKVLRDVRAHNQDLQGRIDHVFRAWSNLNHRNVLSYHGFVTDIGVYLTLVYPWFDNGNILEYVLRHSDVNRIHFLLGAAKGLEYLHSQNVTHGNVKCHNILVSDSGEACVCDFDLDRMYHNDNNYRTSSSLQAQAGQIRWLAPEIISDDNASTTASDVYSFGMTILELLTGQRPFAEIKRDTAVLRAIVVRLARPARPLDPAVGRWLTDEMWVLLERCWSQDSLERPSMIDMVANLREME